MFEKDFKMTPEDLAAKFRRKIFADGVPRMSSRDLAALLDMTHKDMCRLIEQHRAEMERFGPVIQTPVEDDK
jgi:hypothetical protein